jgi:hypothetical protein
LGVVGIATGGIILAVGTGDAGADLVLIGDGETLGVGVITGEIATVGVGVTIGKGVGIGEAGADLVPIGDGETAGVGVITGEIATVGVGVTMGEGVCVGGFEAVGMVWVQAVNEIEPIPRSNLKYFTRSNWKAVILLIITKVYNSMFTSRALKFSRTI